MILRKEKRNRLDFIFRLGNHEQLMGISAQTDVPKSQGGIKPGSAGACARTK